MSTYAHITTDILLGILSNPHGDLRLDDDRLAVTLRVPAMQIQNEIICEQIKDYRESAQKILINYLMSGAANSVEDQPSAQIYDTLETMRLNLITLGDALEEIELQHDRLIVHSQGTLKNLVENKSDKTTIQQEMDKYDTETQQFHAQLKSIAPKFYDALLSITRTIKFVPDYKPAVQNHDHLSSPVSAA